MTNFCNKDIAVYAYFNNDGLGRAIKNARTLQKLLDH